ncbi:hypothetical protein [Staphylococcus shinii]|uniref:hypothetical protein n=1 Tax=Staphylococcus shinii TaxID=2912228 RepID=UPI003F578849
MVNAKFSPSLMTMDLDKFKDQITFLNKHVDSYHIDIMDDTLYQTLLCHLGLLNKLKEFLLYQFLHI